MTLLSSYFEFKIELLQFILTYPGSATAAAITLLSVQIVQISSSKCYLIANQMR